MPASPPTRSPAEVPSGCSPGRMPVGAAALPLLCNLICSLQSLLSQFKDYYSGFWITKQIIINRVRRLVKNCIYPVVFIIYITFRQIPPCHFIPSLFPPLNVNYLIQTHHKGIHFLRVLQGRYSTCYKFRIRPASGNLDKCKLHNLSFVHL